MMPLNNQLMKAEALRKDPEWKRSRLAEWASLHAVRTAVRGPRLSWGCAAAHSCAQASCVALGIIAYKISKKVV